jgi:hypothetical protein
LFEVVHFDFYGAGGIFGTGLIDDGLEVAGELFDGDGGKVIVFDKEAVIQADAEIFGPTDGDGVFIQKTETGEGFPGVVNFGVGAADAFDEALGEGRDAAHALKEIENDTFGGEEGAQRPTDPEERCLALVAVAAFDDFHVEAGDEFYAEAFVIGAADHFHDRQAAGHADFFLVEGADGDGVFGDEKPAGDVVVGGAEVFAAGELGEVFQLVVGREGLHRYCIPQIARLSQAFCFE